MARKKCIKPRVISVCLINREPVHSEYLYGVIGILQLGANIYITRVHNLSFINSKHFGLIVPVFVCICIL